MMKAAGGPRTLSKEKQQQFTQYVGIRSIVSSTQSATVSETNDGVDILSKASQQLLPLVDIREY